MGGDCDIVKAANELMIWCMCSSLSNFRRDGDSFIGVLDAETSYHWGVTGMSVSLIEAVDNSIDEGVLRE